MGLGVRPAFAGIVLREAGSGGRALFALCSRGLLPIVSLQKLNCEKGSDIEADWIGPAARFFIGHTLCAACVKFSKGKSVFLSCHFWFSCCLVTKCGPMRGVSSSKTGFLLIKVENMRIAALHCIAPIWASLVLNLSLL